MADGTTSEYHKGQARYASAAATPSRTSRRRTPSPATGRPVPGRARPRPAAARAGRRPAPSRDRSRSRRRLLGQLSVQAALEAVRFGRRRALVGPQPARLLVERRGSEPLLERRGAPAASCSALPARRSPRPVRKRRQLSRPAAAPGSEPPIALVRLTGRRILANWRRRPPTRAAPRPRSR